MMLLLGGTGLLGGQVVRRLRDERLPFRMLTRGSRDWRASSVHGIRQKGIEVIIADALDEKKMDEAAEECTGIINLVGSMPPTPGLDLEELHVGVVENVLAVAKKRKIQRVIQISCLGASDLSAGEYLSTIFEAEELVRKSDIYWTIFRPSYIFTDRFPLLEALMPLIKFRLFMPVIGDGHNSVQPVHADDVAECVVAAIYDKDTVAKTFDLAGPDVYSIFELMEMARKSLKIGGVTMNVPSPTAAKAANALAKFLPKNSLSIELLEMLMANSTTEDNALESYFNIDPKPLKANLQRIMAQ